MTPRIPKYRIQKSLDGDRAFVRLDGRRIYLRRYNSPESQRRYQQVVAEWLASGRQQPGGLEPLLVVELIARYWHHVKDYYRKPDGTPTSEQHNVREALKPLKDIYERESAAEFGPLKLKAVHQHMIDKGWCRTNINRAISRIKRMFRWAVENELVPGSSHHALAALSGLRAGRSEARESEPVKPVADAVVGATVPHMTPMLRAMVQLQRLTGMRPAEVCLMRTCDIDISGSVWIYKPHRHKTEHHGCDRLVFIFTLHL